LPEAEETISYNMPAFRVNDKLLRRTHIQEPLHYFPHSGTVLPELAGELADYTWTKGTLQFPVDEPMPESLVRRLVEVRLNQLGS
jgi:uncharacterized protein YdhG (YjbR/CyaY superfamily)